MEQVKILETKIAHLKKLLHTGKEEKKKIEKIFTGQLRKLKTNKEINWSIGDIASALSIYAGGSRSYRLIRKRGHPFPSVSTLRRLATKINIQPGKAISPVHKCNENGSILVF